MSFHEGADGPTHHQTMPFGLLGATVTVTATTLDDAVWLVSYVGSSHLSVTTRLLHSFIFVGTLESLSVGCVVAAKALVILLGGPSSGLVLEGMGALLCWTIAGLLYLKKWLKRRRRQLKNQEQGAQPLSSVDYGAVGESSTETEQDSVTYSPWAVMTFTMLGALDEISYFPALLVGGIFTPLELCLGTLLAAVLVLVLVTQFLVTCTPLMEFLDKIPLYSIVALFATILTLGVFLDLIQGEGKTDTEG
jgi:hypothetical protein